MSDFRQIVYGLFAPSFWRSATGWHRFANGCPKPLSDANAQWAPDRVNCLVRLALRPDRKPVECRQGLQARLHIPEVDLALEKRDFIIQLAWTFFDDWK